jgi:hypothetical protein
MLNVKSMNIVITRLFTKGEYTHGSLSIDGKRICSTLENSNAQVPSGEYPIRLIKCKHHARKMPLLFPHSALDAESHLELGSWNLKLRCTKCKRSLNSHLSSLNFTLPCYCPMLKPGNGVHNRFDGSILVGQYNCLGCLTHPKTIFDALYERIRKSLSRGNQVTLTVKDG